MTRRISFIVGIAFTALVVAVPTAFGEGHLAGSQPSALPQPDPMIEDGFAQAIATSKGLESVIVSERTPESQLLRAERLRGEALNRKYGLGEFAPNPVDGYVDANQRVVEPQSVKAERARSEGLNRMYGLGDYATVNGYVDGPERAVPPTSTTPSITPVSVTTSDSDIQWPQIGIGFGIGIVLLFGLGLAMRAAHVRPFAH
jgi:hypothetical protein